MHRIDGEGATSDNKFTEGNPSTGLIATEVTADWLNAIQEEIIAVLTAAGISPSKPTNTQLRDAILSLISGGGVAVSAEGVTIADAGEYFSGTEVESALQQLAAKVYAGTFASSQIRRQALETNDGTTVFQTEAVHAENYIILTASTAVTYNIRPASAQDFPIGTAIQVVQGGAGKVTFVPGSGVTLLKGDSFNARTMEQQAVAVLVKTSNNTWRLHGMLEEA